VIRSSWRQLRGVIDHPSWWLFAITSAGVAVGLAEGLVLALLVRVAIEVTSGDVSSWEIPATSVELSTGALLWLAAGAACAAMALNLLIARVSAHASSSVLHESRRMALEAFGRAAWGRQEREREGSLQETVATLAGQSAQLANGLAIGLSSLLSLITLLVVAAAIDPPTMAVVTAGGLALALALRPLTQLTRRRAATFVRANSAFAEDVTRMTGLVQEYRVFGVQERATEQLVDTSRKVSSLQQQVKFAQRLGWSMYRDVAALLLVAAVAAVYLADRGSLLGTGTVIVLVVRAMTSAQAVQRGAQNLHELGPNLIAMQERIGSLEQAVASAGCEPMDTVGAIEFVDVSYRYGGSESDDGGPALRCVNLRIEPGEVIGIVGPSGAGKSTLVQVLLRLRSPTSGTVLVDGRPYEFCRDSDWSKLVALVPQEPHLMEGSVADNIRFLRDGIDDETIRRAAGAAHVAGEIQALPGGFATRLGPRGVGLSGGQKQRLTIARALAGSPQLVVFDEPTSALDRRSEELFVETIRELAGTVTLVIVAHRASTLTACDRLVVMRDGGVDWIGTPEQLAVPLGVRK
jgi:ATP-binding cassette, subfamily B, bacterial